jgi:DNA-binding transcriptional regulator YiaG
MGGIDLKKSRETLGLTQTELSREFGVTLRTIQRWESLNETLPKYISKVIEQLKEERRR